MTESPVRCPECGASAVARGHLNWGHPGTFTPEGLRFWTLTVGVLPLVDPDDPHAARMSATAHACTACGLVWARLDPERLRTVLRDAGAQAPR